VKRGGSVVWAAEADPIDLDPHGPMSAGSLPVWGDLTYQSLVMFDENLKITPCLAEAWTASSPTAWTFTLREGIKHHDGNELDAEDVRFWYDRLMAAATASPYRREYAAIATVEPKGKYTVELTLSEPYAPLLATLAAMRGSAIGSRRWLARAGGATRTAAVGSGPFKIDEYVPNSHVHYVNHADYWERGLPYLNDVTLRIIPDEAARVDALRSGEVSYARLGPEAGRRLKSEKDIGVFAAPGPVQHLTTFNLARKPFDDQRVRQAISLAVDRRDALDTVLIGEGKLTGPIPTGHGAWAMAPEALPYQRDLKRAKELLAEAGAADGFDVSVKVRADDSIAVGTALLMADQMKEIGVRVTVERLAPDAFARALDARDFDLTFQRTAFLPDPDGYLGSAYHSTGALNVSSYRNPRVDELVDSARGVLDRVARKGRYDEAAQLVLTEAPAIWWFTQNNTEALRASIKGYSQSFTGRRPFLSTAWLRTL
jgi:peptide/nickel transport system substrate-binding protein